jgi:hypothetical protein
MDARVTTHSELEELLRREPTVDTAVAFEFLGVGRDLGFRLMSNYRRRILKAVTRGRPLTEVSVRPQRDADGAWDEIPNHKVGGRLRCRSDLLLWMVYPERSGRAES